MADSEDGPIPSEPVGPMEVAGCPDRTGWARYYLCRLIQCPRFLRQRLSEIVSVFRTEDTCRGEALAAPSLLKGTQQNRGEPYGLCHRTRGASLPLPGAATISPFS